MHQLKRIVVVAGVVAVAAGVLAWRWRERNHQSTFRVVPITRGDLSATIGATGTLEPVEVVDVGAQVAGRISSFGTDKAGKTIDYGSIVEEGAMLARIDDSVYSADFAVARAQMEQDKAGELSASATLEQAKAKFVQAEADWKRATELSRSKLMAASDYDSFRAGYDVARANVSVAEAALAQAKAATVQAQAMLDKAQRNLDFCTIKSPVKGVIIDRRVNIGQTVVASLNAPSLFLIAKDLRKMQIWAGVNEADVGRIAPGAPVTFTCDAFPGHRFEGSVGKVRLNATMTQNVVMYTVEVNTENPDNLLLPYLTANVHFLVQQETNVLLVPNAALRWAPSSPPQAAAAARSPDPGDAAASKSAGTTNLSKPRKAPKERQGTVWLKEGNSVRPVELKLGATDGSNTAVVAGDLEEGQELVTGETVGRPRDSTQNPFLPKLPSRR